MTILFRIPICFSFWAKFVLSRGFEKDATLFRSIVKFGRSHYFLIVKILDQYDSNIGIDEMVVKIFMTTLGVLLSEKYMY